VIIVDWKAVGVVEIGNGGSKMTIYISEIYDDINQKKKPSTKNNE
jgi:hypothetical protein